MSSCYLTQMLCNGKEVHISTLFENEKGATTKRQSRETSNIGYTRHRTKENKTNKRQRKPKGQSRMDNPEKLPTLGKQDTERRQAKQINVRENRRGNQEWTTQRKWKHWVHKTQDADK